MKKLKKGTKGSDVKALQTALNKTPPKAKLKIDGIFGDKTEAAVKAFQKAKRLKQDGIAGEKTQAALGIGKRKDKSIEWPWPDIEQTIGAGAKIYGKQIDIVNAALRMAGKVKTAEMAALEKRLLAALKELTRLYRAQDKPARAVVVLERSFLKAKQSNPSACAGIVKKAKKLAEASVKATIASVEIGETIEKLAADIKRAGSNPPVPRPVEKTRKRLARYKSLRKDDEKSLKKSLQLCRRHPSPGVDALRDKYLAMEKEANISGNSSVPEIMRRLVELEVLEIKYNKAIRSLPVRELRRAMEKIKLIEDIIETLEKGRLARLKRKAALDKELIKQIKLAVFA
ncbi:peptidoglycan-binding protein [Ruegeria sp. HKCCD8929]|uniref:peptidoglycan-binding domain-containing protein n=1 Tax=Ruegeria sp. HKCCD8929 TaxID=2683006 RepID=UPI001488F994|nr:peptidoglycan-binding domain-containing protein [Ruegeria sp. HKCCD8929]